MRDENNLSSRFKRLVSILEANHKLMQTLEIPEQTLDDYKSLIIHLKTRSPVEITHVIGILKPSKKTRVDQDSKIDVESLTIAEIKRRINSQKTTREAMEKIAITRFGMSKGGLSSLRSRQALKEKLESLIEEESAHQSIAELALAAEELQFKKKL